MQQFSASSQGSPTGTHEQEPFSHCVPSQQDSLVHVAPCDPHPASPEEPPPLLLPALPPLLLPPDEPLELGPTIEL